MSRAQFTITIEPGLGAWVEYVAQTEGLKKSGVVEKALLAAYEKWQEDLMREGYQEMAEHDRQLIAEWD